MSATLTNQYSLNGHSHLSNYKRALSSLFDKKKTWNYLNEQREAALKRKKELSHIRMSQMDEVIYH